MFNFYVIFGKGKMYLGNISEEIGRAPAETYVSSEYHKYRSEIESQGS